MARADMKTAYNNMIKYYLGGLNISLINSVVNDYLNDPQ